MTTTVENVRRINLNRVSPELYEAMLVLSNAASKDIDPALAELIKIRASQLNHCAFCLDMHTADARKHGISDQKLALLPAREEAGGVYSEQEQAALALTEAMTDLTGGDHVSDEVYARAAAVFTERELGQVIAMALTINAWNRIGVTTRLPLPRR
jgi:AhpD family alkylhydroperoxidase